MSKKTLWQRLGRLLNPGPKLPKHAQKQALVRQFAKKYGTPYFVAPGTCHTDTPANEDLRAIFQLGGPQYNVLIDDGRCFGTPPAYPSIEQISQLVATVRPGRQVEGRRGCIRIFAN